MIILRDLTLQKMSESLSKIKLSKLEQLPPTIIDSSSMYKKLEVQLINMENLKNSLEKEKEELLNKLFFQEKKNEQIQSSTHSILWKSFSIGIIIGILISFSFLKWKQK